MIFVNASILMWLLASPQGTFCHRDDRGGCAFNFTGRYWVNWDVSLGLDFREAYILCFFIYFFSRDCRKIVAGKVPPTPEGLRNTIKKIQAKERNLDF